METKHIATLCVALAIAATAASAQGSGTSAKSATPAKTTTHHATTTSTHSATTTKSAAHTDANLTAVKTGLESSSHNLRDYRWKETIVVSSNGVEKSTMVNSCSYDATGRLTRTPAPAAASAEKSEMRSTTAATKNATSKGEIESYEHSAVALMHSYIPPDPMKLQKCEQAGHMTTDVVEAGHRVRLTFKNYEKPGDAMVIEVNPSNNAVLGMSVDSFLASAKDAVKLNVDMASLPDGTSYAEKTHLDTPAKNMAVMVTNSDYQKKTS